MIKAARDCLLCVRAPVTTQAGFQQSVEDMLAVLGELEGTISHEQTGAKVRRHREQRSARRTCPIRFAELGAAGGKSGKDSDLRFGDAAVDGRAVGIGVRAVTGQAKIGCVPGWMMGVEVHRFFDAPPSLVGLAEIGRKRRPQGKDARVIWVEGVGLLVMHLGLIETPSVHVDLAATRWHQESAGSSVRARSARSAA